MKQILHIFAKDSRHLWPEILISLAVTVLFTWSTPHGWSQQPGATAYAGFTVAGAASFLGSSLALMVVGSWWLLIARVVHDESLVGERQFWLTRPYQWGQLLAAKVLFLSVYLSLPFLAAKLVLLHLAGFPSWPNLPGLLFNLLLVTASLVLPLLAIATVTASFARLALAVVGVLFCFLSVLAVTLSRGSDFSIRYGFLLPFIPCVCVAVIVLQYASRRLWLARALLIGYPLVILASSFGSPAKVRLAGNFPATSAGQSAPFRMTFAPHAGNMVTAGPVPNHKQMQVGVPVEYADVAAGHMLDSKYLRASVEAPGRAAWTSDWLDETRLRLVPGTQSTAIYFNIPRRVLESFHGVAVTLHLSLALVEFRAGKSQQATLQSTAVRVPGFGICVPQAGWEDTQQITGVTCRSALRPPPFTYVETTWHNQACDSATFEANDGVKGDGWVGELAQAPAAFGISPVWETGLPFSNSIQEPGEAGGQRTLRHLCPGTRLTFTPYFPARQQRVDLSIPNLTFPP